MRVNANPGEVELVQGRDYRRKVFQMQDGRIRSVHSVRPLHWLDAGAFIDVDDTPISPDGGITWTTASTPYVLLWDSATLTLSYTSKRGGDVAVRLAELDGVPVLPQVGLPSLSGQSVRAFVHPELEIELRVRAFGVEILKILHGPTAPKVMTWEVVEGDKSNIRFDPTTTRGHDNLNRVLSRKSDRLNEARLVEMQHSATTPVLDRDGRKLFSVTEQWTGKTRYIDPETLERTWVEEVEYPVEIDVTVTENIGADADDGHGESTDTWYVNQTTSGYGKVAGWRFQTVDVPQGQILDSVTLTVRVTFRGGTGNAVISGEATDDAPLWANASANSPKTMAATTANTTYAVPTSTGIKTIDVLTSVQEIIDRAGWAANNDLRLGFSSVAGWVAGAGYAFFEDYNAAGTDEAQLEIVYTVASGGIPTLVGRRFGLAGRRGLAA